MADGVLCEFCLRLIFSKTDERWPMREPRTYHDLEQSASVFSCPFCKAFIGDSPAKSDFEKPNAIVFDSMYEGWPQTRSTIQMSFQYDHTEATINKYYKTFSEAEEVRGHWIIGYAHRNDQYQWDKLQEDSVWQSRRMDLDNRLKIIDRWLAECTQGAYRHTKCCDITSTGYPARLLDLREVETAGYITLVETEGWPKPSPEYTTLSHCWGHPDGPRPLKTTSENLEAHKRQIQIQDLPGTFRDAVKITLRLGKAFLWIDSLCIVQDDKQDWETEANKMGVIYENSFLTIAATSAENCEGGCSIEPWTWTTIKGRVPNGFKDHKNWTLSEPDYAIKLRPNWEQWTKNCYPPLHRRGWVLQEMCLSRRVLYMAAGQMLWQCRSGFDHENVDFKSQDWFCYHQKHGFVDIIGRREDHPRFHWWKIANCYSKMDFTHISDRLPALAGILEYYTLHQTHDQPLLGLWRKSIACDLTWTRRTPQADDRIHGLPTWTWLSSRSEIAIPPLLYKLDHGLKLDSWSIEWERQPYVSKLFAGTLNVSSKILEFNLHDNVYGTGIVHEHFVETYAGYPLKMEIEFDSDVGSTIIEGRDVVLSYLLLGCEIVGWIDLYFLALLPAPDDCSKYIRMGCGHAHFYKPEEDEMTPELVELLGDSKHWPWFGSEAVLEYLLRDWKDASITLC